VRLTGGAHLSVRDKENKQKVGLNMLLRRFNPGITFKCSQIEQTSQAMKQIVLLEENILFQW
jgi:hypothetical protein